MTATPVHIFYVSEKCCEQRFVDIMAEFQLAITLKGSEHSKAYKLFAKASADI